MSTPIIADLPTALAVAVIIGSSLRDARGAERRRIAPLFERATELVTLLDRCHDRSPEEITRHRRRLATTKGGAK